MALGSSYRQLSTPIGLGRIQTERCFLHLLPDAPNKSGTTDAAASGTEEGRRGLCAPGTERRRGSDSAEPGAAAGPPGHVAVAVRLRPPPARWLGHRLQPAPPGARLGAVRVAPRAVRTRVLSVRPSRPLRMGIHGWRLEEARRSTSPGRGPGAGNCLAESRRTDGRSPARFHAKRSFRCRRSRI